MVVVYKPNVINVLFFPNLKTQTNNYYIQWGFKHECKWLLINFNVLDVNLDLEYSWLGADSYNLVANNFVYSVIYHIPMGGVSIRIKGGNIDLSICNWLCHAETWHDLVYCLLNFKCTRNIFLHVLLNRTHFSINI